MAEGTKDADVIYTDVWVSMGEPEEVWAERINDLKPYQVNAKAFENAKDSAIFMHCLPAFHDLNTTERSDSNTSSVTSSSLCPNFS